MTKDRNALKAGLFILASIALVVGVVFAIQGTGRIFHPTRLVIAAFNLDENLGGLKEGDPVRIGGFDQGRVVEIHLVPDSGPNKTPQFLVTFTLPIAYQLHADAVVQLEQGLTGAANLNFTAFGTGPAYDDGHPLQGTPSSISQLYAIAPAAQKFLSALQGKIEPAYAKYDHVMSSADSTLQSGRDALGTGREAMAQVRDILGDSKLDLKTTIANLTATTTTLKGRLPGTFDRVDGFLDTTKSAVDSAHAALADIRSAAASTKDITAGARSLLLQNRSKIDHMIDSLRDTSINLNGASVEIRHSPWRLLYHPSTAEMGNINVIDTARQFAEGASQVNDAAAAVRDALKDPGIDKARLQQLLDGLNASFDNYGHVEDALWKAVK